MYHASGMGLNSNYRVNNDRLVGVGRKPLWAYQLHHVPEPFFFGPKLFPSRKKKQNYDSIPFLPRTATSTPPPLSPSIYLRRRYSLPLSCTKNRPAAGLFSRRSLPFPSNALSLCTCSTPTSPPPDFAPKQKPLDGVRVDLIRHYELPIYSTSTFHLHHAPAPAPAR